MKTSLPLLRRRPGRTAGVLIAAGTAIVIAIVGAAVVVVVAASPGPSREQLIAKRGAEVMPFDLAATTHTFEPTPDGGLQTVVADDPADRRQVNLVQQHLRDEAAAFGRGEFGDPARIHGADMPGLATLRDRFDQLDVTFSARADGAEIRYRTDDPVVLDALHDWFGAQTSDHQGHAG